MWKSRQTVLNDKETAEIKKIDAEREKAFQESVAIAKGNVENPRQTELALEDKISESTEVNRVLGFAESAGASDSAKITIKSPSEDQLGIGTLKRLLEDLPSLPISMRTGVKTLAALELVAGILERSHSGASELLRNVRLEGAGRADLLLLFKMESRPDLAIDVRFTPHALLVDRAVVSSRGWATRVALSTSKAKKRIRPVAFIVVDAAPEQSRLDVATRSFMDPSEPGAALFLFSFESLANLNNLDLDGSAFSSESSTTSAQF